MKETSHKGAPANQSDDDDIWVWIVIGLIFCGVAVALFAPLLWDAAHT
jgi:hypothetical protein